VTDDQVSAQLTELGIKFEHAGMDEVDAAILARQGRQDLLVENKRAIHIFDEVSA
jgi:hypothetical protein